MKQDQLESSILDLWMKTRIPLTRANLQFHTDLGRKKLNRWLDALVDDGVLQCDIHDSGEPLWSVPGAVRPIDGPETFAALEKKQRIRAEARRRVLEKRRQQASASQLAVEEPADEEPSEALAVNSVDALALMKTAASALQGTPKNPEKHKSLLASAGLSLFGPLGWLYAGSFKEAIPAAAIAMAIAAIVPNFLLMPVLWLAMPISSIVGLVYGFQYNRTGKRNRLFLDDPKKKKSDKDKDS